jgi:hypothetical protein
MKNIKILIILLLFSIPFLGKAQMIINSGKLNISDTTAMLAGYA